MKKHVYIYTHADMYNGVRDRLEEQILESEHSDKSFLVFEDHKEVPEPHSDSIHSFMGNEENTGILVTEY